jgi:STE24 endopeptidase
LVGHFEIFIFLPLTPVFYMVQLNVLLWAFLIIFFLRSTVQLFLNRLNIAYLRRHFREIPEFFQDAVDPEKLNKMAAYTRDSACLNIMATLVNQIFFLFILLSGFLPWLGQALHLLTQGWILRGLLFFASLAVLSNILRLPFSIYDTFVIEERYGFNTKTFPLWLADLTKGLFLSALLGGGFLALLLALVGHGGRNWWLWGWLLLGAAEFIILWLYPILIAPWFNKFEPLANPELEGSIAALMEKGGLKSKGVFRMDASKRSRHTNAYFTGIGKSKRIVLFDTLLQSHGNDEIIAILAHEMGHWKKMHVVKMLILIELASLAFFYLTARMLDWPLLYRTFGFEEVIPYVGLLLVGALFGPLSTFAQPIESALSRRFERAADDFAVNLLKTGEPLAKSLKRLAADNLANLNPHPLYAWFYYSHPPLVERVSRLMNIQSVHD